ncbi:hypothetical protein [Aquincola tertiaricarbonis]|uniref:hypothetical protein n=1 Tax=Aquincola tertiaricarbonis TaxID=391953 RepID=UPI0012ED4AE6|nr:hypothetical protein [Aquincola tertiaricarbonis]
MSTFSRSAALSLCLLIPLPLIAAEAAVTKVLFENERVRAYEVVFAPGAEARNIERPFRVLRALVDGRLERRTEDGRIEVEEWKAGEVRAIGPDKAATRNAGEGEFRLYIVQVK